MDHRYTRQYEDYRGNTPDERVPIPWKKLSESAPSFLLLFATVFLRFLGAGASYHPQLDDYIQYINYPSSPDRWALLVEQGLLSARPLAGISDLCFWSAFSDCFLLAVALISLLFTAAVLLFHAVLRERFGCGRLFVPLLALLPLGIEGTYWLSASTRTVPGLFFTALSGFLLHRYFETQKSGLLPFYALTLLLSVGYYEPILALSFVYSLLLAVHAWRRGQGGFWWGGLAFLAVGGYFALTALAPAADSALTARMEWIFPTSAYYFSTFLPDLLGQMKTVFFSGGILLPIRSFLRAWGSLSPLLILAVMGVGAVWFFALKRGIYKEENRRLLPAAAVGLVLFLAPLAPFFLIANPWFSFRCALPALPGLCFLLDRLICPHVQKKQLEAASLAVLVAVFTLAGMVEMQDYRATTETDLAVTGAILQTFSDAPPQGDVAIFGLNASHLPVQSLRFHEHITGVTESTWALRGMLTARGFDCPHAIVPLPTDQSPLYEAWNHAEKSLSRFSACYLYDADAQTLIPLTLTRVGEAEWTLTLPGGGLWGQVWEENTVGYLVRVG